MRGKAYCFRLIAGSIIFGIVTFGDMLYNKGNWNIYGLLWIVYGSVVFGVFFHLLFSFFMTGIKKSKDKKEFISIGFIMYIVIALKRYQAKQDNKQAPEHISIQQRYAPGLVRLIIFIFQLIRIIIHKLRNSRHPFFRINLCSIELQKIINWCSALGFGDCVLHSALDAGFGLAVCLGKLCT